MWFVRATQASTGSGSRGTNLSRKAVVLADLLVGANTFIGVSALNTITTGIVKTMNEDAILFT